MQNYFWLMLGHISIMGDLPCVTFCNVPFLLIPKKKKKTWENGCELLLFETIELYKLALHYICTQAVSL